MTKRVDKIPNCCPDTASLQAGDILVMTFNPNASKSNVHPSFIGQSMLNNPGGHREASHTGVVVELDNKKMLAHVVSDGFKLSELDHIKSLTHVYRPRVHQEAVAKELSEFMQQYQDQLKEEIKWKAIVTFTSWTERLFTGLGIRSEEPKPHKEENPEKLPQGMDVIARWTVCSKFIAQLFIAITNSMTLKNPEHNYRHDLMNISGNAVPKTLQAYLYRNSHYEYFILSAEVTRGHVLEGLLKIVNKDIERLELSESPRPMEKAKQLKQALAPFQAPQEEKYAEDDVTHDFEQTKKCLKAIYPILKINTGSNMSNPTSLTNVLSYAEKHGMTAPTVADELVYNYQDTNLAAAAKECYGFNDKLADLYSDYRKLGYSDQEACFECDPSFGKQYHLALGRNIAGSVLVLPLLYIIPKGIIRTCNAQGRNEELVMSPKP